MGDTTNSRKAEGIDIIRADPETDRRQRGFDAFRLAHRALPELDLAEVDTSTSFLGKRLSFPLLISPMTGGHGERLVLLNRRLAAAAEAEGVAMGVGSQRVMFTHPASRASFDLREAAPHALLFANLGAVQLNYGFGAEQARAAVDVLRADALCLHLNPLQEVIQPEGNTNFSGLAARIGGTAAQLDVPVIVKEVGSGLSAADAERLLEQGIRHVDVAGAGGTSWSRIEQRRAEQAGIKGRTGYVFQDWGWPTPLALQALAPLRGRLTLIASGGLRSGVDMAKAMVLGASLCGLAAPFLHAALESDRAVEDLIRQLRNEFRAAMFLTGTRRAEDLVGRAELLAPA